MKRQTIVKGTRAFLLILAFITLSIIIFEYQCVMLSSFFDPRELTLKNFSSVFSSVRLLHIAVSLVSSFVIIRILRSKSKKIIIKAAKIISVEIIVVSIGIIVPDIQRICLHKERKNHYSQIYENYYVDPKCVEYSFPEKKKNLVYIQLESFETAYTSSERGGYHDYDLIPELSGLVSEQNCVCFSNTDKQIGGQSVFGIDDRNTMSSIVAQTSGAALKTPLDSIKRASIHNSMGEFSSFLPKLTRLEDIMNTAGYRQLYITGSDSSFAAFNHYIGRYSNSIIYDYNSAVNENYINKDYFEMWGIEDRKVFDIAKQKITDLSHEEQPFFVTIYTMDTHTSEGGYRCPLCDKNIESDFDAAVNCTSRQTYSFIEWLRKQEFWDNTVVILYGDHLRPYTPDSIPGDYIRTTYNCFVNTEKKPSKTKNRIFSNRDMFPTTLSAIGVTILGNRMGLGTDLFSEDRTLCEQLGAEQYISEINMESLYSNQTFW